MQRTTPDPGRRQSTAATAARRNNTYSDRINAWRAAQEDKCGRPAGGQLPLRAPRWWPAHSPAACRRGWTRSRRTPPPPRPSSLPNTAAESSEFSTHRQWPYQVSGWPCMPVIQRWYRLYIMLVIHYRLRRWWCPWAGSAGWWWTWATPRPARTNSAKKARHNLHVQKSWLKILFANLLWEKNTVSLYKNYGL